MNDGTFHVNLLIFSLLNISPAIKTSLPIVHTSDLVTFPYDIDAFS